MLAAASDGGWQHERLPSSDDEVIRDLFSSAQHGIVRAYWLVTPFGKAKDERFAGGFYEERGGRIHNVWSLTGGRRSLGDLLRWGKFDS